jgi:hypothetical protein
MPNVLATIHKEDSSKSAVYEPTTSVSGRDIPAYLGSEPRSNLISVEKGDTAAHVMCHMSCPSIPQDLFETEAETAI